MLEDACSLYKIKCGLAGESKTHKKICDIHPSSHFFDYFRNYRLAKHNSPLLGRDCGGLKSVCLQNFSKTLFKLVICYMEKSYISR